MALETLIWMIQAVTQAQDIESADRRLNPLAALSATQLIQKFQVTFSLLSCCPPESPCPRITVWADPFSAAQQHSNAAIIVTGYMGKQASRASFRIRARIFRISGRTCRP